MSSYYIPGIKFNTHDNFMMYIFLLLLSTDVETEALES